MKTKITLLAVLVAAFLTNFAQQPPNGSFENWTNNYSPVSWVGWENVLSSALPITTSVWTFKDTNTFTDGSTSAKLVTDSIPGHKEVFNGLISLGSGVLQGDTLPVFYGIQFTYLPDSVIFDYQYSTPGTDTAAFFMSLTHQGINLLSYLGSQGIGIMLPLSATWAHVAIPLASFYQVTGVNPDTLTLLFNASNSQNPVKGSTLLVDHVRFGYVGTPATQIPATITAGGPVVFCNGDSVLLSANTGTNYTYQWNVGGTLITGATSSTYEAKTSGSYTVTIDSSTVTATSNTIAVTVNNCAPTLNAVIAASGSTTFCSGDSVVLTANTGTGYTYQWKNAGVALPGQTGSTYTAKTAGSYTVVIDSASINATSNTIVVSVTICTPGFNADITSGGPTTFCTGDSVKLSANTGTSYTYQWNLSGSPITGATGATLQAKAAGSYTVNIDSATASAVSNAIVVTDSNCASGINYIAAATFSVYPNPASTLLNINSSDNLAGYNLQVYDLIGRLVIAQVLTGTNNAVDVAKLANGTYIYRVTDKDNSAVTQNKFNVIK